jgi:hypothetical protein
MHNEFINEFRLSGNKIYDGVELDVIDFEFHCTLEKKLQKLNTIVPNPKFSHFLCDFEIDYDYIILMRDFVQQNSPSNSIKLDKLNEIEFNDIVRKYDSLWLIEHNYRIQK